MFWSLEVKSDSSSLVFSEQYAYMSMHYLDMKIRQFRGVMTFYPRFADYEEILHD